MKRTFIFAILVLVVVTGCTGYQYRAVPFKAADSYPNHVEVFGAVIAAKAWANGMEANQAFGFDIKGAGVTPVQVVVDNKGPSTLSIVPAQTLVRDTEDQFWNLLPPNVALDRIDKKTRVGRVGSKGAATAVLGGAAGAILGAAYGVVSDRGVIRSAYKGAVAGAAVGAVKGGVEGYNDQESKSQIAMDLDSRGLKGKPLRPFEISQGFLFFPGEVNSASSLRIRIRNENTGQDKILELTFNQSQ